MEGSGEIQLETFQIKQGNKTLNFQKTFRYNLNTFCHIGCKIKSDTGTPALDFHALTMHLDDHQTSITKVV